jgi:general L-amino acid transport system permease protein
MPACGWWNGEGKAMTQQSLAYVRTEDSPKLSPPPSTVGVQGWLRTNLFSNIFYSALTVILGVLVIWILWKLLNFVFIDAVWTGADREACLGEGIGACWPMVTEKFPQWVYGFYPAEQRWRVNLCFLAFAIGVIPMLIPSLPYKGLTAIYLFLIFPLLTLILLTGGNFDFGVGSYGSVIAFFLLLAVLVPMAAMGIEEAVSKNLIGLGLAAAAAVLWLVSFAVDLGGMTLAGYDVSTASLLIWALCLATGVVSLLVTVMDRQARGMPAIIGWVIVLAGVIVAMILLDINFGLESVETSQWGGLLVTLVVAVSGIVASLPFGIVLALGRRSNMPIVKTLSIVFIELFRGVPLITVLFMSSVMLPLFLPPGVSFDKLLRALIGVALFSSAYMAETVRGGLQAIPKGQYEGAMAVGLSYWQSMINVILPQALKISIPNIVGNFISLFKDTTLVAIVGLFDLLGILNAGLRDSQWAAPTTAPTGYLAVALMFWVFCFGMSRYAMYTERRLHTGHKR